MIEGKEELIHKLTKEICEWQMKCQNLSDIELEKNSVNHKLTSVAHEKEFLQVNNLRIGEGECTPNN